MQRLSKRLFLTVALSALTLLLGSGLIGFAPPVAAQEGTATTAEAVEEAEPTPPPFQLPFAQSPSLDTWLMAQPYGNTTGAFRRRFTTYGASGGIHFGVDLSAPCGREIVAIADGVVYAVDGPYGSPPHNLMIDHPELGYASMYGHLLEAPDLQPGQAVKQGQVIAKVGDSGETCYSRPHLHLEIRDLNHITKYNPTQLIDANWHNLALIGDSGRSFARDLDEPRKWQTLHDQPQARTAGPIINDFSNPWPLDWEKAKAAPAIITTTRPVTPSQPLQTTAVGRQLTAGQCCTQIYWSQDSSQVRFIDQPAPNTPVGVWAVDPAQPEAGSHLVAEPLAYLSPDRSLIAYPSLRKNVTVIERLVDGQTWEIDTQGQQLRFTPDSQRVTWTTFDEDAPRDNREETTWIANVDGSNVRILFQARRTDTVGWLSPDELLLTRRIGGSSDEEFLILTVVAGRLTSLGSFPEPRSTALSPDRRRLVYYARFEPDAGRNGLWLLDLDNAERGPEKLPFFGAYRWRDDQHLVYVPFDPDATEHNFHEYNLATGRSRSLFPAGTGLTIANNDWTISPDGDQLALVAADGAELDGIWVLDLP